MRGVGVGVASALLFALSLACASPASAATPASITIKPSAAVVGATVAVSGQGYSPGEALTLKWTSVNASWVVSGNPPEVTGVDAIPIEVVLASVQTDSTGSFSTTIAIPVDFGGQHTIQAYASNGTAITGRAIFTLEPSFKTSPSEGPTGTPITVTAKGLGYGLYSTSYHVYWDDSYAGYITAISSRGATTFTIYASGAEGTHYIQIYQGYPGPGYLNPQQGPPSSETQSIFPPYIPFRADFNVTGTQTAASMVIPSLVVTGAALTSLGLFIFVARVGPDRRRRVANGIAALLMIVALVAGGAGAYLSLSPSTNPASTFTPQATVVRPAIVVPENNSTGGPRISVSPDVADVGQSVTVSGAGFAPNAQLPLSWATRKGSNLLGYRLVNEPLRNVTASTDGTFSFTMAVPSDLGGLHYISSGDLTTRSNGTLFIQRTATINATEGPSGTTIAVVMTGVGWTFDTNIAALDYDNSYIGYGCGFNSGGNVTFYLTVTGAPGVHTIDVYPSVWWGPSTPGGQLAVEYRYPLLTPQDHPELMPSFHFTFLITGSGQQGQTPNLIPSALVLPGVAMAGSPFVLEQRDETSGAPDRRGS